MARVALSELGTAIKKETTDKYKKSLAKATAKWQVIAAQEIKPMIVEMIVKGQSPVQGQGRYKDYSSSYKKQITGKKYKSLGKKLRPVNLTLTGEMLRSIKSRPIINGIAVWFSDRKAKYHDKLGAGKSKVIRKMLPNEEGQKFSNVINKKLREILSTELSKELKKD